MHAPSTPPCGSRADRSSAAREDTVAGGEQGGRTIGCCTAAGFLPLSTPPWDPKQGSLLGTNQAGSGLVVLWLATRVRPPMVDSSESAGRSAYRATRGQKQGPAFALWDHRLRGLGGTTWARPRRSPGRTR